MLKNCPKDAGELSFSPSVYCLRSTPLKAQKMNGTFSNASAKCVRDAGVASIVFPCLYSVLFMVALILNSLAAWVFFNIPSTSTFVVFLKNVVI